MVFILLGAAQSVRDKVTKKTPVILETNLIDDNDLGFTKGLYLPEKIENIVEMEPLQDNLLENFDAKAGR